MKERHQRRIKNDKRGIEGLPMKLVIISVVAAACIGILMLWISGIGGGARLDRIEVVEPDDKTVDIDGDPDPRNIKIKVIDTEGSGMKDIKVKATGCGVDTGWMWTEDGGTKNIDISSADITGTITIKAQDPETGEQVQTQIIVND